MWLRALDVGLDGGVVVERLKRREEKGFEEVLAVVEQRATKGRFEGFVVGAHANGVDNDEEEEYLGEQLDEFLQSALVLQRGRLVSAIRSKMKEVYLFGFLSFAFLFARRRGKFLGRRSDLFLRNIR